MAGNKKYFVFETEAEAITACDKCNAGLEAQLLIAKAEKWAEPIQRNTDNKWCYPKPEAPYFKCSHCSEPVKCIYTEEKMKQSWDEKDK